MRYATHLNQMGGAQLGRGEPSTAGLPSFPRTRELGVGSDLRNAYPDDAEEALADRSEQRP